MIFDADGGDFKFQDGGTEIGRIATTNSDFIIDARVADKDIIFKGNDGLVTKTLLTLDSSAAGAATFNDSVTATQFTATSDLAKKENLQVVDNALNKVQTLTGYTYNMKEDGSRKAGLIAQDVEKILPEAVKGEEGNKSLDYSATIALLVNAIKEQQEQINYLRREIEA